MKCTILALMLAATPAFATTPWLRVDADAKGPEGALARGHKAFLDKDYRSVTGAVRTVLEDQAADATVRQNALELLGKAYGENAGKLPADWRLPAGVTNFKFKQMRKEQAEGIEYNHSLSLNAPTTEVIQNLRLVRFPDTVVLDRDANIGFWEVDQEDDGTWTATMSADERREPLADGLYLFTIVLKNGTRTDGWFPLANLVSSASPKVSSPAVGETIRSANPTIRFEDFRSPEYDPSERRDLGVSVGQLVGANYEWQERWSYYVTHPSLMETTVGRENDADGVSALEDGKYWLSLSFSEQRMFGELKLRRVSRTSRPFFVKTN